MTTWYVSYIDNRGDLRQAAFDGELAELAQHDFGGLVVQIERDLPDLTADTAHGDSSISIEKD